VRKSKKKLILNLGCGVTKFKDCVNIDKSEKCFPDICRDICRGLPFGNSTVDGIITSHTLEHLKDGDDLIFVMNECYRVLKQGGFLRVVVPHGEKPIWAWRDPTHYRAFYVQTFWYFCGVFPLLKKDMGITCKFKLSKITKIDHSIKRNRKKIVDGEDLDVILLKE